MSEEDPIDLMNEEVIEQTAKEVVVQSQEISDEAQEIVSNPDGDPCNSYEWSVLFLIMLSFAIAIGMLHLWTLWKRRSALSALDIIFCFFFVSAIIQFGPMLSQVLHSGHGVYHFSQTGCKLLFYTDYGMRHVVSFLVFLYFLYVYLILNHNFDPENLDGKMRHYLPWLIILLFAIEGLFGMPVAIFIDVGPAAWQSCIWLPSLKLSAVQTGTMELILRPITPYLLPMVLMSFSLYKATQLVRSMADDLKVKAPLFSVLIIVWSYYLMNLPYALLLVAETSSQIQGTHLKGAMACNLKWAFFLLHQSWFLVVPVTMMMLDAEKGNSPAGSALAMRAWKKTRDQMNQVGLRV